MAVRNIDSSIFRHAQERVAAARLSIRMLLITGFVVEFFSNLLGISVDPSVGRGWCGAINVRLQSQAVAGPICSLPTHQA